MPYLIEKSCGTRTQVDITADEARYKAQSARVIEIAADGTVIGDVQPDASNDAQLLQAEQEAAGDAGEAAPVAKPAAKKAARKTAAKK